MTQKKISKVILLAALVILICLIWPIWAIFGKMTDTGNLEKRELAPAPVMSKENYTAFSGQFEAFFNDRLPFRNSLIRLYNTVDFSLFGISGNEDVVVGKHDWLFYAKKEDGDPMRSYRGEDMNSDAELAQIADALTAARDELASMNIEFVVFLMPNKERIYFEEMPDGTGLPAKDYGTSQLVRYLKENTDLRVVYVYDTLMAEKTAHPERLLYYKTDTHWNEAGGYAGARVLLSELGVDMPPLSALTITEKQDVPEGLGDLADMMNLPYLKSRDRHYELSGWGEENITFCEKDFFTHFSYRAENADDRKLFVYRDSFCTAISDYLGAQFSESEMVHYSTYSRKDLEEAKPDIFVLQMVERNTRLIGTFTVDGHME
ncbi:MAG: hypothetical protein IJH99_02875 [Eubacterium sp.]|nr:hypothetical protein [Eubacterium sp.]